MTFQPVNSLADLIPINVVWPKEYDNFRDDFQESYRKIADSCNRKEIASYENEEILTGQNFFVTGDNQKKRQTYRKTFEIPALVAAPGPTSFNHNIQNPAVNANYVFTRIYGVIQGGAPIFLPIPNDDIHVEVNTTQIVISNYPAAYNGFTGIITLEYIKGAP